MVGNQAYVIQKGSRMANNSAIASMGYGLPAAIGTCIAGGRRTTICLEGDGSIMMNLQELQTILTNPGVPQNCRSVRLPVFLRTFQR